MEDIISGIFKNRMVNFDKLIEYGFEKNADGYLYSNVLNGTDFILTVSVDFNGNVLTKIIDPAFDEPYTLHLISGAVGSFVSNVKSRYEEILFEIAEKCYEPDVFKSVTSKQVISYLKKTYGDEPEYLWKKFTNNAVWRRKDNRKWYCILLTVSKRKLGLNSDETVEILDFRVLPERLQKLIDNQKYYPGYHMNKKHWATVILDGSVEFSEICDRINDSYLLACKK